MTTGTKPVPSMLPVLEHITSMPEPVMESTLVAAPSLFLASASLVVISSPDSLTVVVRPASPVAVTSTASLVVTFTAPLVSTATTPMETSSLMITPSLSVADLKKVD